MTSPHHPPMHRMMAKLPSITKPEIKAIIETLVTSVTAQADLYACLLFLEKLSQHSDAQKIFSASIVSLSSNFSAGIFTSTTTIEELLIKIRTGEFVPEARNRIIVSFTSIFEAAIVSAIDHFNIQKPAPNAKYADFDGKTYDTKTVNMWLKLYQDTLAKWPSRDYFSMAVDSHAANYWSSLYKARNAIVHTGSIAKKDQVTPHGKPWGVTAVGQPIKTDHDKVDDIIQFFDNSFGHFLCDLDRYPQPTTVLHQRQP